MKWQIFVGFFFFFIVVGLLVFYWFFPLDVVEFGIKSKSSNFSLKNSFEGMQFYPNMRYVSTDISYRIEDCPLQKKNNMERAFEMISNGVLNFYAVNFSEQISVTCDSGTKIEEGLFVAGEGGPTEIIRAGEYYVILHGSILLIRDSKCSTPNIAIHELLHALGFEHSENSNNIMYPISGCDQTIGQDVFNLIGEVYSLPSYADLEFENVSAIKRGLYLDINFSVKNNGFKKSASSKIIIYADGKIVKELDLESLDIGYGKAIMLGNVLVPKLNVNELELLIDADFQELKKNNNRIKLEIKN